MRPWRSNWNAHAVCFVWLDLHGTAEQEDWMNPDETPELPAIDERRTRELCNAERDGVRCIRSKGHAHHHEAFQAAQPVTWQEPSSR